MTAAAPVPGDRRSAQWPRGLAHRGRPVTSGARAPFRRPPAPAASACAPGRAPARPPGLPRVRPFAAGRAGAGGTSSRRSAGSPLSTARAGTSRDTRSSAVVPSCSWSSPLEAGRPLPPRRLPGITPAAARSRRRGGSPDRRRVDQLGADAKVDPHPPGAEHHHEQRPATELGRPSSAVQGPGLERSFGGRVLHGRSLNEEHQGFQADSTAVVLPPASLSQDAFARETAHLDQLFSGIARSHRAIHVAGVHAEHEGSRRLWRVGVAWPLGYGGCSARRATSRRHDGMALTHTSRDEAELRAYLALTS